MKPVKIVIPFTLPGLNDYIAAERVHRQKAAKMKRYWQEAVIIAVRRQIRGGIPEPCYMHYRWIERDRRRDKDNIAAFGRKVIQDALVQMKALRNDGWNNIEGFSDEFAVDKKKPRIEVLIGGISMVDQECNFEHLYNQTKYMLEKYQDEIVPAFRELIYDREPIDRTPLLKCGDLVEINPEHRKNKWKKGTVSQVLLCKGDEWVYNITVRRGYPETKHFSCKDEDIGEWVKPVR